MHKFGLKSTEEILKNQDQIICDFHDLFFRLTKFHTSWLGVEMLKPPTDIWKFQELIWLLKPDYFIEVGTHFGGTAYFIACLFDIIGKGKVITIDIQCSLKVEHPRIHQIIGNSVDETVVNQVREIVKDSTAIVDIDSCHAGGHTLQEMQIYSEFVSPVGSYLISEDTSNTDTWRSVEEFLKVNDSFVVDKEQEKFLLTFNWEGFLRRIK